MRSPLILGAGPAGCAAAITLANAGAPPLLIDRDAEVGDALCGGFMSWRTAETLRGLGINLAALGAHRVSRLAIFAGERCAMADLPAPAFGLSRRVFDTALREAAVAAGARLQIDKARAIGPGLVEGEAREWRADTLFLASGKHDVRGHSRPREAVDAALGLRIRLPSSERLAALVGDRIELHFFVGGYAGIVLQEDGSANVCLAVRKSLLGEAAGQPHGLLNHLAARHSAFGERMAGASSDLPIDTIASVPYGYIRDTAEPGLFHLGDQAAVIPSLAGEGMSIAVASGVMAAEAWLAGGADSAPAFQQAFARRAWRPVRAAEAIWHLAERESGASLIAALAGRVPMLTGLAMRASRIAA